MRVVRQADDPFVCFGAKPNKGLGLEISEGDRKWGRKGVGKGTQRGQLAKRDRKRQSTTVSRRRL